MKATLSLVARALSAGLALCACRVAIVKPIERDLATRRTGDAIVVCGASIPIGAPVVTWTQFPGYDATRATPHFQAASVDPKAPQGLRYQPGRVHKGEDGSRTVWVEPGTQDIAQLAEVVDQFVLHFDVCGTSQTCFRVLHDERGLSVHFLLDIDGTIYQTLDVRDQAFHATKANSRSIGIEIANIGAYALPTNEAQAWKKTPLDEWYARDAGGPYIAIPARLKDGGVRTPGFVGRPVRAERVCGTIQGEALQQYDFTREQYRSLVKLVAGLCRVLPKIAPEAPRDEAGHVRDRVLTPQEFDAFRGILGHYHVQANKIDPGPAFDWERFLAEVRAELAQS